MAARRAQERPGLLVGAPIRTGSRMSFRARSRAGVSRPPFFRRRLALFLAPDARSQRSWAALAEIHAGWDVRGMVSGALAVGSDAAATLGDPGGSRAFAATLRRRVEDWKSVTTPGVTA